MYLVSLELRSAPGPPHAISLNDLGQGLILLVGPNASGKSTIGRTLRGTLWSGHAPIGVHAHTTWRTAAEGPLLHATLAFKRTVWDTQATPISAELADTSQLTLQELLSADASSDREIARRIQTQLDGGYDLSVVGPAQVPRTRPLPSLRKHWEQAAKTLRDLLDATDRLADREARLAELEVQAREAAAAPARLEQVKRAQRRLEVLDRISAVHEGLHELPTNLADLPANAEETAQRLVDLVAKRRSERDGRLDARVQCTAKVDRYAFSEGEPSDAVVADLMRRAEELVSSARDIQRLVVEVADLAGRVSEFEKQVWSGAAPNTLPDRRALETLTITVVDLAAARARLAALPVGEHNGVSSLNDQEHTRLVDARSLLRQWLSTPRQLVVVSEPRPNMLLVGGLIIGGLLLGVIGLLLAFAISPWVGWPVAALGLGCVGAGVGLLLGPRLATSTPVASASEVEVLEQRYREREYSPLAQWSTSGVEAMIADIEGRLRTHERSVQAHEEASRQSRERARAAEAVSCLSAALSQAGKTLGLAVDLPDLALLVQADRIRSLGEARASHVAADRRLTHATATQRRAEEQLRRALDALRLDDLPPLDGAAGLLAGAQAVSARQQARRAATGALATAVLELRRASTELEDAERQRDEHLRACGVSLDDLDRLGELAKLRIAWEQGNTLRRDLERELANLARGLPAGLPDTAETLAAEHDRLDQLGSQLASVSDEISTIRAEVREATDGRTIQEAIARRDDAHDALVADRDAHLEGHAAAALVLWLRRHRSMDDAPVLLGRARAWFLRFTRNRYELLVNPEGGFLALDTHTDRRQALSELSDGTRIQLLLAARLAFVEHSEQGGEKTPLFLDEVLSTSDPQRFAAVATAVLELAAAGRQVFYATSDTAEVYAWQQAARDGDFFEPQLIELSRHISNSGWVPPPRLPTGSPTLPTPDDRDAIEYIAALGLPRPTLHDPVKRWPLALVLHDRLPAAHHAATAGLLHLGQLDLAEAGVAIPLGEGDLAVARARAQALRAAVEAIRVGRGRAVTWEAVSQSGAVSPAFQERVQDQIAMHGHDARAFLLAVAAIPRFRVSSRDDLAAYLEEAGILDLGEPLTSEVVVERAQKACRAALAAGQITLGEIAALERLAREIVGVTD